MKKVFPRKGRYEVFTNSSGMTYCFDDPNFTPIRTPAGMFEWIRSQDPELWHPVSSMPDSNIALYLQPKLYTMWKIKYGF